MAGFIKKGETSEKYGDDRKISEGTESGGLCTRIGIEEREKERCP